MCTMVEVAQLLDSRQVLNQYAHKSGLEMHSYTELYQTIESAALTIVVRQLQMNRAGWEGAKGGINSVPAGQSLVSQPPVHPHESLNLAF